MHSERNQASKMEIFGKIVIGLKPLTIFTKNSTLDIRLSSDYASVPEIDTFAHFQECSLSSTWEVRPTFHLFRT